MADPICDDCGKWNRGLMRRCETHGMQFCAGCVCPLCEDSKWDEEDEETAELEDRLERALNGSARQ